MPDKNIEPGTLCWLKSNHYENPDVDELLEAGTRRVTVVEEGEYDEEWGERWYIEGPEGKVLVSDHDLSPMPSLRPDKTGRGFNVRAFTDLYGSTCSVQDSSLATDDAIWLGVDDGGHFNMQTSEEEWRRRHPDMTRATGGRMHLSRGQVAALLPLLQHFVASGMLPSPEAEEFDA